MNTINWLYSFKISFFLHRKASTSSHCKGLHSENRKRPECYGQSERQSPTLTGLFGSLSDESEEEDIIQPKVKKQEFDELVLIPIAMKPGTLSQSIRTICGQFPNQHCKIYDKTNITTCAVPLQWAIKLDAVRIPSNWIISKTLNTTSYMTMEHGTQLQEISKSLTLPSQVKMQYLQI